MKQLNEKWNWPWQRKEKEPIKSAGELVGPQRDVLPDDIFKNYPSEFSIFVEWLTQDLKDPIAVYWRENWENIKPTIDHYERTKTPGTISVQEFEKIKRKTWGHIGNIKRKFPYDVFDAEDCQEKLNLLNGLQYAFIEDPTRTTSQIQEKLNELKFDPKDLTPYEYCAIDISKRRGADREVGLEEEQLIEKTEALLDEATELEREHIKDALSLPPEELAFNELFDGKLRLVIDYKPLDPDSPLGKFYRMWVQMGYEVDWEKGMVSAVQEVVDMSPAGASARLFGALYGSSEDKKPRPKRFHMKIGKWLAKIHEYAEKIDIGRQKVLKFMERTLDLPAINSRITGKHLEHALTEEELKKASFNL